LTRLTQSGRRYLSPIGVTPMCHRVNHRPWSGGGRPRSGR